ncbi:hypothetical protein B296_00050581 [Ensete ventricosum]|uniref:Uncharacterized protein n=1 Tax=Ensete ventricosum TaxID=4639 RepID=A0A426X2E6_ENSVE|nr:hypothetical protein B296_00050581 [Ensete ventricosum]
MVGREGSTWGRRSRMDGAEAVIGSQSPRQGHAISYETRVHSKGTPQEKESGSKAKVDDYQRKPEKRRVGLAVDPSEEEEAVGEEGLSQTSSKRATTLPVQVEKNVAAKEVG